MYIGEDECNFVLENYRDEITQLATNISNSTLEARRKILSLYGDNLEKYEVSFNTFKQVSKVQLSTANLPEKVEIHNNIKLKEDRLNNWKEYRRNLPVFDSTKIDTIKEFRLIPGTNIDLILPKNYSIVLCGLIGVTIRFKFSINNLTISDCKNCIFILDKNIISGLNISYSNSIQLNIKDVQYILMNSNSNIYLSGVVTENSTIVLNYCTNIYINKGKYEIPLFQSEIILNGTDLQAHVNNFNLNGITMSTTL